MIAKKKKEPLFDRAFSIINGTVMITLAFICMYPLYYVIIYSVSSPLHIGAGITFWPKGFSLQTYKTILSNKQIYNAFFISVSRTLLGTLLALGASTFFAFLLTQQDLPYRKLIYRYVVGTMYINAGLIPWYLTMSALGFKNNFLLYIVPTAISAFNLVLIKTYMEQLPSALQEAAEIDGAGYFTIYLKIIAPLCKPIIATIAVFVAVGQWNSWTDNYFLVSDQNLQTLQMMLYRFLAEAQSIALKSVLDANYRGGTADTMRATVTPQTVKMCVTIIVTAPILLVYPFVQKYFVNGIMIGAVKG